MTTLNPMIGAPWSSKYVKTPVNWAWMMKLVASATPASCVSNTTTRIRKRIGCRMARTSWRPVFFVRPNYRLWSRNATPQLPGIGGVVEGVVAVVDVAEVAAVPNPRTKWLNWLPISCDRENWQYKFPLFSKERILWWQRCVERENVGRDNSRPEFHIFTYFSLLKRRKECWCLISR